MNAGSSRLKASSLMAELAANGRHHFTTAEMRAALGVSEAATRLSLSRLAQKRLIASPARGFYVILPPEYKRLGCLPADQFIPALMAHLKRPYYAALLSAAQYHGAAHHRPQTFQVALDRSRRSISCGAVDVSFIVRKRLSEVPIQNLNTPRGTVRVSSVEATAVDVVGYEKQIGGLDQVATVLAELAAHIDPDLLSAAARTAPVSWAQRLGYLLGIVGAADKASSLKIHVRQRARDVALLLPAGFNDGRMPLADDWRLRINTPVEVEV